MTAQLAYIETSLRDLAADLEAVSLAKAGRSSEVDLSLRRYASKLTELSERLHDERKEKEVDEHRIKEIVNVLFGMASLKFSGAAPIRGDDSLLDALAVTVNMLSEELQASMSALHQRTDELQHLMEDLHQTKEKAEDATKVKSQFLANMSHEIRTPLTALLGFSELLLDPKLGESERLNYAMTIRRNSEHLLALINGILDLSKIEFGKLSTERVECSVIQILNEVASLMQVRAVEKGLSFGVELETPIPDIVYSDPTRLRQVILNLVANAIKFTKEGEVKVVARYRRQTSQLQIGVTDTGIGMDREHMELLFQPFQQGDSSMGRRFGGTGLGLAICRPLANALGGDIHVQSTVGKGSTFTLEIVAEIPEHTPFVDHITDSPPPHASRAISGRAHHKFCGTILLAEDGPDNQLLISTLLKKKGLHVDIVPNGKLAVERIAAVKDAPGSYDLVLMDMQMPELDGYQAAARLREMGYDKPIVALTAHAMEGEREHCLSAGCDDYIRKPVDRLTLFNTLADWLYVPNECHESTDFAVPLGKDAIYSEYGNDPDMVALIRHFVAALPGRIDEMRKAGLDGQRDRLRRAAHQLKSAAGGYGFNTITKSAAHLEDSLKTDTSGRIWRGALDDLISLCERVQRIPSIRNDKRKPL